MTTLLHRCGPGCAHDPALPRTRSAHFTIDVHCHVLTPEVEARVAGLPGRVEELRRTPALIGPDALQHNQDVMGPVAARRMTHLDERLADMEAMGVDLQVISPSPTQYHPWADEALADVIGRLQNVHIAELCARHPSRLRGLGSVALQHPALAVRQVSDAVAMGLVGVEISSTAGGRALSDPALEPFWKAVHDADCIVFLHPLGTSLGERVNTHYLSNVIGQPLETTIALSQLVFDGVFDRHPGLRLIAAHGGGYLPSYLGRTEHAAQVRPEAQGMRRRPVDYLREIWFDTVVHDPLVLRHLIDTVGVGQVVVGTDYPYDMGDYDVHGAIASIPGIDAEQAARILGGNAARLLGLDLASMARR